jgi:uncharacterized protein involved in exopolysaccharide biosynthesis
MRPESLVTEDYARKPLPTLRDIVAILFRQYRAMLITFVVVIAAALLSGKWVPTYEARMKILVLHQRSDATVTPSASMPAPFNDGQVTEEDLNTEVELLSSEDLLRKVVLAAGLNRKPGSSADGDSDVGVARAVRQLAKELKIDPARKSDVISVSYRNHDPRLAAQVLQALSSAYTEKHLELHHPSGEFNFFDQQTQQYLKGLNQAQAMLTDFTKSTGVVSAQMEKDAALAHANDFDATARQTRAAIAETEQRVQTLQAQLQSMQPRITTVVRSSDNPQLLQQLKSTLLNLELKRTELLRKYEPNYRLVQEVERQIADAKSAITAAESNPIRDQSTDENPSYQLVQTELLKAQADLSGLKARVASSAAIAGQYKKAAQRLDQDVIAQQNLLQATKTQEENYLLYVHKREEARIDDELDQRGIANVALAEMPVVPALPTQSPVSFALATLLLALTLSFAAAFVVDLMDPSFRTTGEVASYLGIPVFAAMTEGAASTR